MSQSLPLKGVVLFIDCPLMKDEQLYQFKEVASSLGARVSKLKDVDVSHIIYENGKEKTLRAAEFRSIPVVLPTWIWACVDKKAMVDIVPYKPVGAEDDSSSSSSSLTDDGNLQLSKVVSPLKRRASQSTEEKGDALAEFSNVNVQKQYSLSSSSSLSDGGNAPVDSPLGSQSISKANTPKKSPAKAQSPKRSQTQGPKAQRSQIKSQKSSQNDDFDLELTSPRRSTRSQSSQASQREVVNDVKKSQEKKKSTVKKASTSVKKSSTVAKAAKVTTPDDARAATKKTPAKAKATVAGTKRAKVDDATPAKKVSKAKGDEPEAKKKSPVKVAAKSPTKKVAKKLAKSPAKKATAKSPAKEAATKAATAKSVAKSPAKKTTKASTKSPAMKTTTKAVTKSPAKNTPAKKAPEKKAVAKSPAKEKSSTKTPTTAKARTKTPKASTAKKSVTKSPAKKATAKATATKKLHAKKATAKATTTKKSPAKKATAKKSPAKKAPTKKRSASTAGLSSADEKKSPAKKRGKADIAKKAPAKKTTTTPKAKAAPKKAPAKKASQTATQRTASQSKSPAKRARVTAKKSSTSTSSGSGSSRRGRKTIGQYHVTITGAQDKDRIRLTEKVRVLSDRVTMSDEVEQGTTHVIVCDAQRRTKKVLRGIVSGAHLVKATWLLEGNANDDKMPSEQRHEIKTWKGSRVRCDQLASKRKGPLHGQCVFLTGKHRIDDATLREFIEALGAEVVENFRRATVAISGDQGTLTWRFNRDHSKDEVPIVTDEWVVACVAAWAHVHERAFYKT